MRLLHISDLHLGRKLNQYSLYEEQQLALEEVLKTLEIYDVEGLLIAGDIYDTVRPSKEAMQLYSSFIERATKYCPVIAIAGNHDNDAMHHAHRLLLKNGNYYVAGKVECPIESITLYDENGPINFYLLPYTSAAKAEMLNESEEKFSSEEEAIKYLLSTISLNTLERNVLLFHGFVTGKSEILLSQSERENTIGTAQAISASYFKSFDYVAMGHLHRSQRVDETNIYYSGSIYGYSESEIGYSKNMLLVDLDIDKTLKVEPIPFNPKRILKKLTVFASELEQMPPCDDYLFIELKDKEPVLRLQKWLSQRFSHLVSISQPEQYEVTREDSKKFDFELGLLEQIKQYYELVNQEAMSGDVFQLLTDAFKELEEDK